MELFLKARDVAVLVTQREAADGSRDAWGLRTCPVVPAVVAPPDNPVSAGEDPCEAHRRTRGIRARLEQVRHVAARCKAHQRLAELHLIGAPIGARQLPRASASITTAVIRGSA